MTDPLAVLLATTVATAILHTLIPDHWLPFVLVARSEGWPMRRTLALTAGSAALHVVVSLGLGFATQALGRGAEAAVGIGESIEHVAAALLILFGVLYAGWFLLRGGHHHSFGIHPHHEPGDAHSHGTPHPHDLTGHPPEGGGAKRSEVNPAHRAGLQSGLALAAIVGFNPCVLIVPYIYLAGSMGATALATVALSFALSTVLCMVGVVILGLKGTARLESRFLIRYGEALSGGLIALTGLLVLLLHVGD